MTKYKFLSFTLTCIIGISCSTFTTTTREYESGNPQSKAIMRKVLKDTTWIGEEIFYQNGQLATSGKIKDGMKEGAWNSFQNDGILLSSGRYRQDLRNGKWKWFRPDGSVDSAMTYKDGVLNGAWKKYFQNGEVHQSKNYLLGRLEGAFKEFSPEGQLLMKGGYLNGIPTGIWAWYENDGLKSRTMTFLNGKKNGPFKAWKKEGLVTISGEYANDLKQGEWKWYRTEKDLDSLVTYDKNIKNGKYSIWLPSGTISIQGAYNHDLMDMKWTWYSRSGDADSLKNYKKGILDGPIKHYFAQEIDSDIPFLKNRSTKISGAYKNGKYHDEWIWNAADGSPDSVKNYSNGFLNGPFQIYYPSDATSKIPFGKKKVTKISGSYINDKYDGVWEWRRSGGELDSLKEYKSGLLFGSVKKYYSDGQLMESAEFINGKLNGIQDYYSQNGGQEYHKTFRMDTLNGEFSFWNSNGLLTETGTYSSGRLHGIYKRWYSTGQASSITNYSNGTRDGYSCVYSPSGVMTRETYYRSDDPRIKFEYHDNSRIKGIRILMNDAPVFERKWNNIGVETSSLNLGNFISTTDYYASGNLKNESLMSKIDSTGMEWTFDDARNMINIKLVYLEKVLIERNWDAGKTASVDQIFF